MGYIKKTKKGMKAYFDWNNQWGRFFELHNRKEDTITVYPKDIIVTKIKSILAEK